MLLKILVAVLAVVVVTEAHAMRWYSPNTGRWLSRDPIEERGGGNLYRFVSNRPTIAVDPDGRFLLAVDGTSSAKNSHYNPKTQRWDSHVHNFYADYKGPGKKLYMHGPNLAGEDVPQLVKIGYKAVCRAVEKNPNEVVNMVGHSRGGLVVIAVAQKLKDEGCKCLVPVNVNFMGLYDAVDRAIGAGGAVVPNNVQFVAHARRDPSVHSRSYFGNSGTSGGASYLERFYRGTHAAIGGDPDFIDYPANITVDENHLASYLADTWIREEATFHGAKGLAIWIVETDF